jgi:hypothetical protein
LTVSCCFLFLLHLALCWLTESHIYEFSSFTAILKCKSPTYVDTLMCMWQKEKEYDDFNFSLLHKVVKIVWCTLNVILIYIETAILEQNAVGMHTQQGTINPLVSLQFNCQQWDQYSVIIPLWSTYITITAKGKFHILSVVKRSWKINNFIAYVFDENRNV